MSERHTYALMDTSPDYLGGLRQRLESGMVVSLAPRAALQMLNTIEAERERVRQMEEALQAFVNGVGAIWERDHMPCQFGPGGATVRQARDALDGRSREPEAGSGDV